MLLYYKPIGLDPSLQDDPVTSRRCSVVESIGPKDRKVSRDLCEIGRFPIGDLGGAGSARMRRKRHDWMGKFAVVFFSGKGDDVAHSHRGVKACSASVTVDF